jgi:hypothetical protein
MAKTKDVNGDYYTYGINHNEAGNNFKSNRLQRIFGRSKSISKNFVRHMNK